MEVEAELEQEAIVPGYRSHLWPTLIMLVILVLAFGLRFHNLGAQSLWNDEGNSARLSERTIPLIIEGTASDIHPPLYYLMLRGWRELAGETEFGLRAFSAVAGVLTVAATVALAKTVISGQFSVFSYRNVLLLTGLLTAVSPPLIYYSQEARMYSLLGLLATVSSWLLLNLLRADGAWYTGHRRLFAGYILAAVAGLYTHYAFPAVLIAHGLIVFIQWFVHRRVAQKLQSDPDHSSFLTPHSSFSSWLLSMLAAFLLYLPWLPIFLRQTGGGEPRGLVVVFLEQAGEWLLLGSTVAENTAVTIIWAAAIMIVLGLFRRSGDRGVGPGWMLVLLAGVPVLFLYAVGATQPQFLKFLTMAVPPTAVLLSLAVGRNLARAQEVDPEKRNSTNALPLVYGFLLLLILSAMGQSLMNLYANPDFARADYRGMAQHVMSDNHSNAGVILDAPNQWEVFTYYFPDVDRVYPLPTSISQPTTADIATELAAITDQHDRLYTLFWGETQRDPERLVERWLDENAFKATEEWVGDVRFVVYALPEAAATEMETAVGDNGLAFGDDITLQGFTLREDTLQAEEIIQLTLFWETAVVLDARYKVFLHLLDADGQLVAQRDSEPGGNLSPTTNWQPGTTITDNHGILIPADTPPGEYSLLLGLYDLTDPDNRLPIRTDTRIEDVWNMAKITVRGE